MGYNKPPIIVDDSVAITAASQARTLLAANALVSYRIYGISVGVNRNSTGFTDIWVRYGTTEFFVAAGLTQGKAHGHVEYEFPGVMIAANTAVGWVVHGTAAAGQAFCYVWYYTDPYTP